MRSSISYNEIPASSAPLPTDTSPARWRRMASAPRSRCKPSRNNLRASSVRSTDSTLAISSSSSSSSRSSLIFTCVLSLIVIAPPLIHAVEKLLQRLESHVHQPRQCRDSTHESITIGRSYEEKLEHSSERYSVRL